MTTPDESNTRAPSTTWEWRRVKIRRPPEAHKHVSASALSLKHLSKRNPRDPLSLTIKYRGGPEAWWEIRTRGAVVRVPGHASVHDVFDALARGGGR